jgi:hypothetical protein
VNGIPGERVVARRRALIALVGGLIVALSVGGAMVPPTRPDFTGTWVLDVGRSNFGKLTGLAPPTARTDTIRHVEPNLRDAISQVKSGVRSSSRFDYVLDGRDRVMEVGGQNAHYTATWYGDTLGIDSKLRMMVFEIAVRERWTRSRDGRELVLRRHLVYPLGEGDQLLRFRRKSDLQKRPAP